MHAFSWRFFLRLLPHAYYRLGIGSLIGHDLEWDRFGYLEDDLANFPIKSGAHNGLHNRHMDGLYLLAIRGHNLSFLSQQAHNGTALASWLLHPNHLSLDCSTSPNSIHSGPLRGNRWPQNAGPVPIYSTDILGPTMHRDLTADSIGEWFLHIQGNLFRLRMCHYFGHVSLTVSGTEKMSIIN